MRRRDFIALAGAAVALPRVAVAQQPPKVPRVVWLSIPQPPQRLEALRQGLSDLNYVEGKTVTIEEWIAATNADLPLLAAKAAATKPDVIVSNGTPASLAAKAATNSIPIVFPQAYEPIVTGLVASLSHPGGNLTGVTLSAPGIVDKQIALLGEATPTLKRLALLELPVDQLTGVYREQVQTASAALKIEVVFVGFVEGQDFAAQFDRVVTARVQGIYVPASTYFAANRDLLFDLFLKNKLPAMSVGVTEGAITPFAGLISYGPSISGVIRRSASFVDAILRGAKPADLPVEQPTIFDLAVNLDTARKIGLTIPPSILAQATLVVDEDWRAPKGVK